MLTFDILYVIVLCVIVANLFNSSKSSFFLFNLCHSVSVLLLFLILNLIFKLFISCFKCDFKWDVLLHFQAMTLKWPFSSPLSVCPLYALFILKIVCQVHLLYSNLDKQHNLISLSQQEKQFFFWATSISGFTREPVLSSKHLFVAKWIFSWLSVTNKQEYL